MHFVDLLVRLENTQFSNFMRGSVWAEPVVETVHVLTLALFLGFTVLLDLRLLGMALKQMRARAVLRQLNPWIISAYVVMLATGILLFCGDPVAFWATFPFKAKMVMLCLAGLNVLVFNWTVGKQIEQWDEAQNTPMGAKIAAVVSITLWVSVIAAGRAIAYVIPPPS